MQACIRPLRPGELHASESRVTTLEPNSKSVPSKLARARSLRVRLTCVFSMVFGALLVFVFASIQPATARTCSDLFETYGPRILEWPVEVVSPPKIEGDRLLNTMVLHKKFKEAFDAMSAGRLAMDHMRSLPREMSAREKAKTWIELVNHITNYEFILFTSEMYKLPEGRFLFRGATGDALFIDNDGMMYRTRTWPLDRHPVWDVDYSKLRPLN